MMLYLPKLSASLINISTFNKAWESITGIKLNQKQLLKAGRRIHLLERYLNTREGISRKDDTLPERFLKEGRKSDPKNHTVPLHKMLDKYYKIKGYDNNGIPKNEVMKRMQIDLEN
jgi:aldehyde:ferredoxin oxidoreductase